MSDEMLLSDFTAEGVNNSERSKLDSLELLKGSGKNMGTILKYSYMLIHI